MNNPVIKNIYKHIHILKSTAYATYKEWAAYRSHMAVTIFVGPVFFLVQMFIWKAIFQNEDVINGFTYKQMLYYYGITALINYLTFDFADWNLQMLVNTGKFLTFMLRPVSHSYFAFSQKVGHRILSFCFEFIPVYLIFFFIFRIKLIPAHFFWLVLSISFSFILVFLTNYTVGMIAFWLTKTNGIRRAILIFKDICAGTFLPLTFFPSVLQGILFFLPFQFLTYVPVRVFIGKYELAGITMSLPEIVLLQGAYVLIMVLFSRLIWFLGIKRFTGVGA